ncbi:ligase-associated DNA damage response DEXH box helicase [Flavihumibacter fluvii]|uniref:ligase-associated DNA damage response DEXH box helicase n=1 Tax=Flavihumibacter fluvii TaxID=2838157 RepID=UPI001BDE14D0|nr:ligase-associated DNA damage response DEXH box helicase [Flavihumibacter fluvii]ULQ50599.1 ligase-associated DNA damage response DEXH box helicase [Flavihumibacter fluvii]
MNVQDTIGYRIIQKWLSEKGFSPFPFQQETWNSIIHGESGLVNAPTGYGKTYSVFLGALIQFINEHPGDYTTCQKNGLQLLWVTPLRALAKDIGRAMEEVIIETGLQWQVGIRNGDTPTADRQKQKRQMPEVMIITPESLHLLLAQKDYKENMKSLRIIAVDEWHELLGSKRGVQVELAISRLRAIISIHSLSVFAISATIGNLEQARDVLLAPLNKSGKIIRANVHKSMQVTSIFPDEIEKYPWAGHLGIKLVEKIIPIIRESTTTLLFINTRGMTERWYQAILEVAPDLAGAIAIHHGSIEHELRIWVEEALHNATLKVVVCTASLDLGVDFRPVETVIQVGSPKGVARFMQRAGRSGHQPGATSRIYFLPTHSLELVEAAALQQAIDDELIESKTPLLLCFDVLIQYLCTLAVSDGFHGDETYREVTSTYCYREMTGEEWMQIIQFITTGGRALKQYDDYKKVEFIDGKYKISGRRNAMRHRLHIGTIVSDAMLKVKFISGGFIGVIEEYFISKLIPGEVFTLAGRNLELVMIKDMTVLVRKSNAKKTIVPSWMGGRMPLSANLGRLLREQFNQAGATDHSRIELKALQPLFDLQASLSHVPRADELLIEQIETKDGFHLFVFPFEGRLVHEAMAAILAYRISRIQPISFSFAMNDYGFELLSDQPIPVDDTNVYELFSTENLFTDIQRSVNSTEMAKRKFRDIAVIGGLIFQGMPGEQKNARHLQSSASLLFSVFQQYDGDNLLMRQAFQEVFDQQMEEARLRDMLERIQRSRIILRFPEQLTPFCFPVKVDSMREILSSEKLEDRIRKMQLQLSK